jgi:hypothetical protein
MNLVPSRHAFKPDVHVADMTNNSLVYSSFGELKRIRFCNIGKVCQFHVSRLYIVQGKD